jgi:hypothetical protein
MMHHVFLEEAHKIADNLEEMSKRDDDGHIYWETWHDVKGKLVSQPSASLYSGNTGILLFFYELYRQTKNDRYFSILISNINWILKDPSVNEPKNISLYYGSLGASYILAKCATLLNDQSLLDKSLDIALKTGPLLNTDYLENRNELLGGASGILYCLTSLYHLSQSGEILNLVKRCVEHIINDFHCTRKGIYWDREYNQVKGLCGMSHGVSGIASVLMEIGHYFNNEPLKSIASFAFDYENTFYDRSNNNWRDLRVGIFSTEYYDYYKNLYLTDKKEDFYNKFYMDAWCHGAPGIGFARLRAFERTGASVYKRDLNRAIQRCMSSSYLTHTSLTLCHGLGSIVDLYLEAAHVLKDERLRLLANKTFLDFAASKSLADKYKSGFEGHYEMDASLFNGIAGIGHLCLRLHSPDTVPSVLTPALNMPGASPGNKEFDYLTPAYVINRTLKKRFPKTIELIDLVNKADNPSEHFKFNQQRLVFSDLFKPLLNEKPIEENVSGKITTCIKSRLRLEKLGHVLDAKTDNHLYSWVKYNVNQELLKELTTGFIWTLKVKPDPAVCIVHVTTPEDEGREKGKPKVNKRLVMLQARWDGVKELYPEKLAILLFKTLQEEAVVEAHFHIVKGHFPMDCDEVFLRNIYLEQLKELIRNGLILMG